MFGFGRRRSFDRQGQSNDQNSTGYQEKTVFPTDFGSPENNNYQNAGQSIPPQSNGYDSGYAQGDDFGGDYTQPVAPQSSYGYGQSVPPQTGYVQGGAYAQSGVGASNTATEVRELPMVFASRKHDDIYIYEYSDRLEYYLRTATRMYLVNTVKKQ